MQRIIALVVFASGLGGSLAEAQSTPRYRLIDTDSVTTAQLARVVREGYRVSPDATVAPWFLVLERTGEKREYLISDALLQDARARFLPGFAFFPEPSARLPTERTRSANAPPFSNDLPDETAG